MPVGWALWQLLYQNPPLNDVAQWPEAWSLSTSFVENSIWSWTSNELPEDKKLLHEFGFYRLFYIPNYIFRTVEHRCYKKETLRGECFVRFKNKIPIWPFAIGHGLWLSIPKLGPSMLPVWKKNAPPRTVYFSRGDYKYYACSPKYPIMHWRWSESWANVTT